MRLKKPPGPDAPSPDTRAGIAKGSAGAGLQAVAHRVLRHPGLRWAALAVAIAASCVAVVWFHVALQARNQAQLRALAVERAGDVAERMRANEDLLFALRGFFGSAEAPARQDFRRFARSMAADPRHAGLREVSAVLDVWDGPGGAAERVGQDELGADAPPAHASAPAPAPAPVIAAAADSEARERAAVERARDTGLLISASTRDGGATDTHADVLLRLALYQGDAVPDTLEARRKLYRGVVGSTLHVPSLFAASGRGRPPLRLRVSVEGDADAPARQVKDERLLFETAEPTSGDGGTGSLARLDRVATTRLAFGDQLWILRYSNPEDPGAADRYAVAALLALFVGASGLLVWLLGTAMASEARLRELAERARETALLGSFGVRLQACRSSHEIDLLVALAGPDIFPHTNGKLFVLDASGEFSGTLQWGGAPPAIDDLFGAADCEALRQGHVHWARGEAGMPNCLHFTGTAPACYACAPLLSGGKPIGMLHLQPVAKATPGAQDWKRSAARTGLFEAVATMLALAYGNLRLSAHLRDLVSRDDLTGLHHREFMKAWFEHEAFRARRLGESIAMAVFDLDGHRGVGAAIGTGASDQAVRLLAASLRTGVGQGDLLCRLDDDRFALLFSNCAQEEALARAEALRDRATRQVVQHAGVDSPVTLSVGLAVFPDDGEPTEVQRCAESAAARARDAGGNLVMASEPRDPPVRSETGPPSADASLSLEPA